MSTDVAKWFIRQIYRTLAARPTPGLRRT
jgi:hypothetical protein